MKQITANPAMLAITVLACGILACTDCDGGIEAEHAKLGRPASPATIDRELRKTHRAANRAQSSRTRVHGSRVRELSAHRPRGVKPATKSRLVESRQAVRKKALNYPTSEKASSHRQTAMRGLASFYWDDTRTASGDRFDRVALTGAHRTLPFGTRLRVTNVRNGLSVTVRINDRGPFIRGRIIDVTLGAAKALGMIDAGVILVSLAVVR